MRAFLKNSVGSAFFAVSAAIALAAPAQAASVLFDFGIKPSGTSGNQWDVINGTHANGRIFSAVSGATTVNVRASAWSVDSGGLIRDSFLGGFTGAGLGVTSGDASSDDFNGTNGRHAVDNQTRTDFIVLQFDRSVDLDKAKFNAIQISGLSYKDTDATIGGGNTVVNWMTQLNLNNQNISALNTLIPSANRFANAGGSVGGTRAVNPANFTGNVWLISTALAAQNSDGKIDAFKLGAVEASFIPVVPEPETWAMMIFGFGLVGGAIRRRRQTLAAV